MAESVWLRCALPYPASLTAPGLGVLVAALAWPAGAVGWKVAGALLAGLVAWTLLEYVLHRFVLHGVEPFRAWHLAHHRNPTQPIRVPLGFGFNGRIRRVCPLAGLGILALQRVELFPQRLFNRLCGRCLELGKRVLDLVENRNGQILHVSELGHENILVRHHIIFQILECCCRAVPDFGKSQACAQADDVPTVAEVFNEGQHGRNQGCNTTVAGPCGNLLPERLDGIPGPLQRVFEVIILGDGRADFLPHIANALF